jgi:hypothetical protein
MGLGLAVIWFLSVVIVAESILTAPVVDHPDW